LTGKLPILLNVLDKLPIKAKDQGAVSEVEEARDIFQQLLGGMLDSHEVGSVQRAIHKLGACQNEKYKDSASIFR